MYHFCQHDISANISISGFHCNAIKKKIFSMLPEQSYVLFLIVSASFLVQFIIFLQSFLFFFSHIVSEQPPSERTTVSSSVNPTGIVFVRYL